MQEAGFKPRAYERAARTLESLEEDISEIYKEGGLKALEGIPSIGKSLAFKIEEFIKTGKIKTRDKLRGKCPVDIAALTAIEGIGPRMVKVLYQELKIRNIKDLEKAAKAGKIRKLEHFGEKSEKNILEGIAFIKRSRGRFLLGLALSLAREIINDLKTLEEIEEISEAGSLRRRKETIGDIDILAVLKNKNQGRGVSEEAAVKVIDFFVKRPDVIKIWAKGPTKASVRLKDGLDCDLRVIKKESFGSALQYFTGSKEHNIITRRLAILNGLKLNEYGLFRGSKRIAGKNEKEVYAALNLSYIEPELRENNGEIEAAQRQARSKPMGLPKIIGYDDILGDLQCHTKWSDGANSIEDMVKAGQEMGYKYIAITDHAGRLKVAGAMDEKTLLAQMKEIDKMNKKFKGFKILKGCEVNILDNGRLDIRDEILAKLDVVLAGVHSKFKMPKEEMTERLIRAMENPHVDIIVHPTGRLLFWREAYQFDYERIFKTAKKTKTALEINACPARLDLKDTDIKKAIEAGVKLAIGTDSHDKTQLRYMELGIAQARRGWAEKKDILNTQINLSFY